jgi:predicted phosphodiesterase
MISWPESFESSFEHYYLPKWIKNLGIMSDTHIPYHNIPALNEAVNYFQIKKIDALLLNGDILDCYMLSKFQPDPRKRKFWQEIEAFKQFITALKEVLSVPIYYKIGNHEERYIKVMISRCAEFLDISNFEFENVLGCKELRVEVIKDQRIVYIGGLAVLHGHEVGMKAISVNPARTLFLKTHASSLCSHLHRTSQHTEPSINEDITCWSTGHLGEEHPAYARINKWNHGIARVEADEAGNFEVINFGLKANKLYTI